jgi:menaquinone-dependent protoporphyrinogen oxidase
MSTRSILLAYATRYGSTQEVAETIAAALRQAGLAIDVQPMQQVKVLDDYGAVVLGAAIYNARWHPAAHRFLSQHERTLWERPVAIFALGPLTTDAAAMQKSRRQLDQELDRYPWLKPVALEIFVGKFDPSKPGLGLLERLMPASDRMDWDAIRAWANALPPKLQHDEVLHSV